MDNEQEMSAWVGGITVLLQSPMSGGGVSVDVDEKRYEFINALLVRAKEVEGPLINGIWAVTFEVDQDTDSAELVDFVKRTWQKYARKVQR